MKPQASPFAKPPRFDKQRPASKTRRVESPSERSRNRGGRVNEQELRKRLENLRVEHRDLDAAIAALTAAAARTSGGGDQLQIARLKKRKLAIRDQIFLIEDNLLPDIIA